MPPRTHFSVHRCTTCGRDFRTAAGLAMHEDAVHATERAPSPLGGLSADDLNPPFPRAAGRWVPLEEFTGHKSFGIFWCPTCEKRWLSAHAFRDEPNQQQCKICDDDRSPVFMWVNDVTYYRSDSEGSTESTEVSTPFGPPLPTLQVGPSMHRWRGDWRATSRLWLRGIWYVL